MRGGGKEWGSGRGERRKGKREKKVGQRARRGGGKGREGREGRVKQNNGIINVIQYSH